jgi:DNA-binding transcriptional LysR family regulator
MELKLTLKQLDIFRAVVVSGSISNARKIVGLSQPTISQQLAKMEELLGAQLIRRGLTQGIEITPAGEFWYRVSQNVLGQMNDAENFHKSNFSEGQLELHFGITPSLKGIFLEVAAKAALEIESFARFELVWAQSSVELLQMIVSHRINCAIVSAEVAKTYNSSLHIQHLFDDEIVWIVPRNIPEEMIEEILTEQKRASNEYGAMGRYVTVGPGVPWASYTADWYRSKLPNAIQYFSCMTHHAAVDLVAGGMATCHGPVSLLPNLSQDVLSRVKCFRLNGYKRQATLIMPKHLLSIAPFVKFAGKILDYYTDSDRIKDIINEMPYLPDGCDYTNKQHATVYLHNLNPCA